MYLLSVLVGNVSIALMFQSEEKAQEAHVLVADAMLSANGLAVAVTDDFGQELGARGNAISGVVFEDMDKSKLARAEQMIHQARAQAAAQKLGQADATLRAMHGSPSVLTPQMGPNGFRN